MGKICPKKRKDREHLQSFLRREMSINYQGGARTGESGGGESGGLDYWDWGEGGRDFSGKRDQRAGGGGGKGFYPSLQKEKEPIQLGGV